MSAQLVSLYPEGGYECDFVRIPPNNLLCGICLHVLRDAHLTSCCGHHFCYSCINKSYQRSNLCPLCQNTFTVFQAQNIIREVNALQVRCRNKAAGCEWVGPLKQLEEHVSNCGFVSVLCNQGCGQYVQNRLLQKHLNLLCPMRKYDCDYCRTYISTYQDVKNNHWKVCEHFPVPCPNDCPKGSIARGRLMDHLKKECKIKQQLAQMRSQNSQLTEKIRRLEKEIATKDTRNKEGVEGMQREIRRLENEIATKDTRNKGLEDNLQTQTIRIKQLEQDLEEKKRTIRELENTVTQVQEEGVVFSPGVDRLNDVSSPEEGSASQEQQPDCRMPGRFAWTTQFSGNSQKIEKARGHYSSDSEVKEEMNDLNIVTIPDPGGHLNGGQDRKQSRQRVSAPPGYRQAPRQRNELPIAGPEGASNQEHNGDITQKVDILHDAHVKLEWTRCRNLPEVMYDGSTAVVGDFVYAGGGICERTINYESVRTVFGYNYRHDTWVNLPTTDRHKFTLVSYQNQLVLVGGATPGQRQYLSSLAVWDEKTRQWIKPYPPMHTQRMQPSAVSHGEHIVVAGGTNKENLDSVEVYDGNTKQWHLVSPLPAKTSRATSAILDGVWYLIGGNGQGRAVHCTSLDSLIREAVQPQSGGCDAIWKSLPSTDFTFSTAAVFGNAILAIGGSKSVGSADAIRAYYPGRKCWLALENPLPRAFYSSSAVVVPTGELILIGGCTGLSRYNHVYKASFKHFS